MRTSPGCPPERLSRTSQRTNQISSSWRRSVLLRRCPWSGHRPRGRLTASVNSDFPPNLPVSGSIKDGCRDGLDPTATLWVQYWFRLQMVRSDLKLNQWAVSDGQTQQKRLKMDERMKLKKKGNVSQSDSVFSFWGFFQGQTDESSEC